MTIKTKYKLIVFSLLVLPFALKIPLFAQNCSNDSTGLIAITDLGSSFYQGFQGGLYFGTNLKPVQQSTNLNNAIADISPLNNQGYNDNINGKIVLLSIGASNPKTEFESFPRAIDMWELSKDGFAVLKPEYEGMVSDLEKTHFERKIRGVNHKLHGIYNQRDKGTLENQIFWQLVMQYRHWVKPGWDKRFGTRGGLFKIASYWNERRQENVWDLA